MTPEERYKRRYPSPAEAERLALLAEECGEVIQAVAKVLRHGYESKNPDTPNRLNRMDLEDEIGDVLAAIELMLGGGEISQYRITKAKNEKLRSVLKYLHHAQ